MHTSDSNILYLDVCPFNGGKKLFFAQNTSHQTILPINTSNHGRDIRRSSVSYRVPLHPCTGRCETSAWFRILFAISQGMEEAPETFLGSKCALGWTEHGFPILGRLSRLLSERAVARQCHLESTGLRLQPRAFPYYSKEY